MKPLSHPPAESIQAEAILHALSDPSRAAIFARIMMAGCVQACSALSAMGERTIPKSSLSNHFKVLREAGLIRSERHGVEMRNHSRFDEVDARFPGLLTAILGAYAAGSAGQAAGSPSPACPAGPSRPPDPPGSATP